MSRMTRIKYREDRAGYAAHLSRLKKYYSLVFAGMFLSICASPAFADDSPEADENSYNYFNIRSASILPIAMYDSDIGFGFGIKSVMQNYLGTRESSDLQIFFSTKGEQNYASCFCFPDRETRQGTRFPMAVDFQIEFDKLLKSNFFGIGNEMQNNEYQFPRESFKIDVSASRAINNHIIAGTGSRYIHYSAYDYDPAWQTINDNTAGAGETDLTLAKVFASYDTRNSAINPGSGIRWEISLEQVIRLLNNDWDFTKIRSEFSLYHKIISPKHILAYRIWLQHVSGKAPYQELSKIGDSWTARGFKADRFLDRTMALVSAEYRFPLYKKLGGAAFFDDGRVWSSPDKMNLKNWHNNLGAGLRLYLKNFVTRLDISHSDESTRIFLNFGHVF
jgi:outer membrane protein assembly factor BamA